MPKHQEENKVGGTQDTGQYPRPGTGRNETQLFCNVRRKMSRHANRNKRCDNYPPDPGEPTGIEKKNRVAQPSLILW
jgi:hypothetical protein